MVTVRPWKIIGAYDNFSLAVGNAFDFVAPFAGCLDRSLDSFAPEFMGRVISMPVRSCSSCRAAAVRRYGRHGSQRDSVCLRDHRLENFRMTVALVHGRVGCETIQILVAVDVVHPASLGALDHHVQRMIVVGSVVFFEFDEFLSTVFSASKDMGSPKRSLVASSSLWFFSRDRRGAAQLETSNNETR